MRKLNYCEIKDITIQAEIGSAVGDCINEAIILAVETNTCVVLFHNDSKYSINPNAIASTIYRQESKP